MHLPPMTRNLLWILAIAFLAQQFLGDAVLPLMLWPFGEHPVGIGADGLPVSLGFQPWQLLTYGFLHGGFGHLFFNGIALYQFGSRLEYLWGPKKYLTREKKLDRGAGLGCHVALMMASVSLAGMTGVDLISIMPAKVRRPEGA